MSEGRRLEEMSDGGRPGGMFKGDVRGNVRGGTSEGNVLHTDRPNCGQQETQMTRR